MKILYVSQYFPPEMGAPAARVSELAREWRRQGHQVTVLTGFAHHPVGVKAAADRWRLTRREDADGVEVLRAYVVATPNAGVVRRMVSYASFMLSAIVIGLWRVRRPEVIVATSPQLLCACAGYLLARAKRVPFVFEVRDLWPESILAVEAMGDSLVVRGLRWVARHLYEHSDRIVTVGEGYQREIHDRYGIPVEKLASIPNGVSAELFSPSPKDNEVRREHGWGGRFVVMYVGTLGMAHGLAAVLDAAAQLRDDSRVLFVFVGEGAEKRALQESAAERGLDNVQFIDHQSKQRIPLYYAACDVGLVMLRAAPLFQSVLPSKIFEYLAMERPIILGVGGQAREIVGAAGAGVFVPPENSRALVEAIVGMAEQSQDLPRMGAAGRRFVLEHFNRREQATTYLRLLESVVTGRRQQARRTATVPEAGR